MQAAKASPIDVSCQSESTHHHKLEGNGSNSAMSLGSSSKKGEKTSQQYKREDSSGSLTCFSVEKMDAKNEILGLSKS